MDSETEKVDWLESPEFDSKDVKDPDTDALKVIDLSAIVTCDSCGYQASIVSMKVKRGNRQIEVKSDKITVWHTFGRLMVRCPICNTLVGVYMPRTPTHLIKICGK